MLDRMATALVRRCSTMVIATGGRQDPWAAPVYYVWSRNAFWFYSSDGSRHIRLGLEHGKAAAALWEDADTWRKIQGLQMQGRLSRAEETARAAAIALAYTAKFPRAAGILKDRSGKESGGGKVRLYAFRPDRLIYTNNRFGLGFRRPVRLEGDD